MAFANILRSLAIGPTIRLISAHAECWSRVLGLDAANSLARACTCGHAPSGCRQLIATSRSFAAMTQLEPNASQPHLLHQNQDQRQQQQPQQQVSQQGIGAAPPSPQRPSTGYKKTFYKRKLPCPPAIEFSSPEGRQLFQEALLDGSMVGFFKLMEQFNTQDEPAFCGLASLTMVLNALSIDPRRTWKGAWRWFHEAMLDCCRPLDVVKEEGITLYQASCLARCNGARVELRPYGTTSLEQFRSEVEAVCRSGEEHVVVSYSRKAFLQTGDGHFSPIGGYHRERDLALVLDVARFKYPPHWVPLPMLYHAMSYLDPETGRPRGYMRMSSNPLLDSVLLTLDVRSDGWQPADRFVRLEAPQLVQTLAAQGSLSGEDVVRRVVDAMPLASLDAFLVVRSGAPLAAAATTAATTLVCKTEDTNGGASPSAAAAAIATVPATGVDLGADAAACSTPEVMAAAVRRASEYGSAAAADAAAATASSADAAASAAADAAPTGSFPPQSKPQQNDLNGSALPPEPAAKDAALGVPSHPRRRSLQYASPPPPLGGPSSPTKKSCGSGAAGAGLKACGSGTCGSNATDGGSSSGSGSCGGGPATAPSLSGSSSSTSLMAAAAAVFTAHDRCIPLAQRQQLLDELRGMPLYSLIANHLAAMAAAARADALETAAAAVAPDDAAAAAGPRPQPLAPPYTQPPAAGRYLAEKVVMALLMQRPDAWPAQEAWRDPAAGAQWEALLGLAGYSVVEAEVSYLREQLVHIDEVLQSGDINGTCGEHSSRLDCAAHGH